MITLADAKRVLAAAERKAEEIGQPMNIAVVDTGGNLVAHVRMDKAWIGSVDIAINKAWTSRAFDISTKELAELSQSGDQFFGIHASNRGRVMIFAGGIPLKRGDDARAGSPPSAGGLLASTPFEAAGTLFSNWSDGNRGWSSSSKTRFRFPCSAISGLSIPIKHGSRRLSLSSIMLPSSVSCLTVA
jgi:uncharacterized protein GlcG (DUF336 family)